jgi:uncharacterized membrane protein
MDASAFEVTQWVLRILLAALFIGMGIAHFLPKPARGMAAIIPPGMRGTGLLAPIALVRFTGLCEIAGGIGLLIPALHFVAGIALVFFLIAVFPANSYAAQHPEKFGRAAIPFWPRYLAQLALIALCILAAI